MDIDIDSDDHYKQSAKLFRSPKIQNSISTLPPI